MTRHLSFIFAALTVVCGLAAGQPCDQGRWSHDFPDSSFTLDIRAVTTFDDGTGPLLYAGGNAGYLADPRPDKYALTAKYLGVWKGGPLWERVGGLNPNWPVDCFVTFDDGSGPALYVGGEFSRIGDQVIRRVGKWDGKAWSPLASGLLAGFGPKVRAMAVFDDGSGPALYAGGYFTSTGDGGTPLSHIARWDGQAWRDVGGGMMLRLDEDTGGVFDLKVFDDGAGPALYAAGSIVKAGGVAVNGLAKWDGKAWSVVGEPLLSPDPNCPECPAVVKAMAFFDDGDGPALWATGWFKAPGVPFDRLARQRNGKWEPAGVLYEHNAHAGYLDMRAFAVHDDGSGPGLYIGGIFETTPPPKDKLTGGCVAKWDRASGSWIDLNGNPDVNTLYSQNDQTGRRLWVGGEFDHAGGKPNICIGAIGAGGWEDPPGEGRWAPTEGVAVFDDGRGPAVYLAGGARIGGAQYRPVARYGPDGWSGVGDLLAEVEPGASEVTVMNLRTLDVGAGPALYGYAYFSQKNNDHPVWIVRWDGRQWAIVGNSLKDVPGADRPSTFTYDDGSGLALYLLRLC